MNKQLNKKLYNIFIWLIIYIYIFPSCSIFFGYVYAAPNVAPGTRIDIEDSVQQSGGNLEGNIRHYNWVDPCKTLYDIWLAEGGTDENGLCYISAYGYDWIFVAVEPTFGKVGDYIQVHVNHDGVETDYPMIIFDQKNPNDGYKHVTDSKGQYMGHDMGGNVADILEFVYDTTDNSHEFRQSMKNVKYIINGGSYYDGPPEGLDFTGSSSSGGGGGGYASFWGTVSKLYSGALDAIYTGFENLFKKRDDMTVAYDLNDKDDKVGNGKKKSSRPHGDILEVCKQLAEEWAARGLEYSLSNLSWRKYRSCIC